MAKDRTWNGSTSDEARDSCFYFLHPQRLSYQMGTRHNNARHDSNETHKHVHT